MIIKRTGFSLVEVVIVMAIMLISVMVMTSQFSQQQRGIVTLEFQNKREQLSTALASQVLSNALNCKCLFQDAEPFPVAGIDKLGATEPTAVGRFNFITPNDCSTATIPAPLISTTPKEGIRAASISLQNITHASGAYSGYFVVQVESTKQVFGSKILPISIPVNVSVTPVSATEVAFEDCSINRTIANTGATYSISPFWGGNGGISTFSSRCPEGMVVTGASGRAFNYIDQLRIHCGNYVGMTAGGLSNPSGGTPYSTQCPSGKFVTGIAGRHASYIDRIQLLCSDLDGSNGHYLTAIGGAGGNAFTFQCPPGSAIYEIRGREGDYVDSLQVVCKVP